MLYTTIWSFVTHFKPQTPRVLVYHALCFKMHNEGDLKAPASSILKLTPPPSLPTPAIVVLCVYFLAKIPSTYFTI